MVVHTDIVTRDDVSKMNYDLELIGLAVPQEFALYLDMKYPHRTPVVRGYEVTKGLVPKRSVVDAPLHLDTSDRLEARKTYNIVIQARYLDFKMLCLIFINGQLRDKFPVTTLQDHFQDREAMYDFTVTRREGAGGSSLVSAAHYWPRVLSYLEIRHLASEVLYSSALETDSAPEPSRAPSLSQLASGLFGERKAAEAGNALDAAASGNSFNAYQ